MRLSSALTEIKAPVIKTEQLIIKNILSFQEVHGIDISCQCG